MVVRRTPVAAAALACLALAATPALAETLTVTGISSSLPGTAQPVLSVPAVSVVDGNLDEAAIRALFATGPAAVANNLAGLDAALVSIPLLTISDRQLGYPVVIVRNVSLEDVKGGVAGHAAIGGVEVAIDAERSASLKTVSATGLNIKGMLGLYGLVADDAADGTLRRMYDGLDLAGLSFAGPEIDCTVRPITLGALDARPLAPETMSQLQKYAGEPPAEDDVSPQEMVALVKLYADILTAYQMQSSGSEGAACDVLTPGEEGKLSIGQVTQTASERGISPAVTYSDIAFEREDGWVKLGALTLKEIDFTGGLAELEKLGAAGLTPEWLAQNFRKLLPATHGFALADVSADVPSSESGGSRNQIGLKGFDLTLSDYINGIPARIAARLERMHVTLAPDGDNAPLIAMGYDTIDVDAGLALHWDRDAQTLLIDEVSARWDKAAAVRVTAVLGNATAALFGDDLEAAQRAAMGLTIKSVSLDATDEGLLAKGVAMAAAEQNVEPGAFRQAIASMLQGTVLIGLGGSPDSVAVSKALMDFVNGAVPHLLLTATAIDPKGISLADLEATQDDPRALLTKVKLTADNATAPAAPPAASEPPAPPAAAPAAEPPAAPAVEPSAPAPAAAEPPAPPSGAPAVEAPAPPAGAPATEPAPAAPEPPPAAGADKNPPRAGAPQ